MHGHSSKPFLTMWKSSSFPMECKWHCGSLCKPSPRLPPWTEK